MTKEWFAVVTKRNSEKKVAKLLLRNNIEAFCPTSLFKIEGTLKFFENRPLISAIVFVRLAKAEIDSVLKVSGVKYFLHWLQKPAVINHEDILHIASFSRLYHDIEIEQCRVGLENTDISDVNFKTEPESIFLPSLGLKLVAKMENYRLQNLYPTLEDYKKVHFSLSVQ